jgi:hypothetical protein
MALTARTESLRDRFLSGTGEVSAVLVFHLLNALAGGIVEYMAFDVQHIGDFTIFRDFRGRLLVLDGQSRLFPDRYFFIAPPAVSGRVIDRDPGLDIENKDIETDPSLVFDGIRFDLNA